MLHLTQKNLTFPFSLLPLLEENITTKRFKKITKGNKRKKRDLGADPSFVILHLRGCILWNLGAERELGNTLMETPMFHRLGSSGLER